MVEKDALVMSLEERAISLCRTGASYRIKILHNTSVRWGVPSVLRQIEWEEGADKALGLKW